MPYHSLLGKKKTNPCLATASFQVVTKSDKVTPKPPFLQAKQPQFSQLLLIRLALQTLLQLCCQIKEELLSRARPLGCWPRGSLHAHEAQGVVFSTNSLIVAAMKKINTNPAKTSIITKVSKSICQCSVAMKQLLLFYHLHHPLSDTH